jgi:hypothetical protein
VLNLYHEYIIISLGKAYMYKYVKTEIDVRQSYVIQGYICAILVAL